MAVSISLSITQNSQSITNNTSNVTVTVTASWTYSSWNGYSRPGWVKIDGTQYNFSHSFNSGCTSSGSEVLYTATVNVGHATDGTKTLSCSASYDSDVSSGVVTASASKTLTTIPRKSTLSVSDGTLNTAHTLTVTRQSTSFTHSIKAVCGNSTLYIKSNGTTQSTESKHSGTSISFTPPLSWASENTSGTSVSVTYTLTTYNGSTVVGANTYTKTYSIPASVKPSCTVAVSDPTGNLSRYGRYVKTKSKFRVVVNATKSYESNIASYSVSADGSMYLSGDFTTDVLKSSGTLSVIATVKDNRGRTSDSATQNLSVYDYTPATVSSIKVDRCNDDLTPNAQGSYCKVTFSAAITSLGNINTATYKLKYKKTSASSYTTVTLSNYSGLYNVTDGYYVFAADTASSYDVIIEAVDDFGTGSKSTSVSTAFSIMHFKSDGTAMAIGKLSEKANTLEVNMDTEFSGNLSICGNFLFDLIYPIGSLYMSINNTDPGTLFGGAWERIEDKFILSAGSTYTAGTTGGEAAHTLTENEMPSHAGHMVANTSASWGAAGEDTYYLPSTNVSKYGTDRPFVVRAGNEIVPRGVSRGSGAAHNNMPPYLTVYVWKRTALAGWDAGLWRDQISQQGADFAGAVNSIIDSRATDFVVEHGVDPAGWNYRKWASGIAEAWKKGTINNVAITTSIGSGTVLYRSNAVSLGKPTAFTFKTITHNTTLASASNTYVWAGQNATEVSSIIFAYTSNTVPTLTLSVHYIGTWK